MNIVILCNRDVAANYALNLLLPALSARHRVTVFASDSVGGGAARADDLELLRFFEQTFFNDYVFALARPPGAQAPLLGFDALRPLLRAPVTTLNNINREEGLARLAAAAPELVLSIRYGVILREAAIAMPRHGVINLHSGILPAYRGVMATFRAMLHGEREIGTSVHYIRDPGIDTGELIAIDRQPVDYARSYFANTLALYPTGCRRLLEVVQQLDSGAPVQGQAQTEAGRYFSFPDAGELERFQRAGYRLVCPQDVLAFAERYR